VVREKEGKEKSQGERAPNRDIAAKKEREEYSEPWNECERGEHRELVVIVVREQTQRLGSRRQKP